MFEDVNCLLNLPDLPAVMLRSVARLGMLLAVYYVVSGLGSPSPRYEPFSSSPVAWPDGLPRIACSNLLCLGHHDGCRVLSVGL